MQKIALLIALFCFGCSAPQETAPSEWMPIASRNGEPVYRAITPKSWIIKKIDHPVDDTTLPIFEAAIDTVRITVHSFPSDDSSLRIPPRAQVERWKRQVQYTESETFWGHGGFIGIIFEGSNPNEKMLAFAMQPGFEQYQAMLRDPRPLGRHKRADYTIKAVGTPDAIETNRQDIEHFANTFELIEEIPLLND